MVSNAFGENAGDKKEILKNIENCYIEHIYDLSFLLDAWCVCLSFAIAFIK